MRKRQEGKNLKERNWREGTEGRDRRKGEIKEQEKRNGRMEWEEKNGRKRNGEGPIERLWEETNRRYIQLAVEQQWLCT